MSKNSENSKKLSREYKLIGNIVHDGDVKNGSYISHVYHKPSDKWFEIQDLHLKETLEALVQISQSYIQIYERKENLDHLQKNSK